MPSTGPLLLRLACPAARGHRTSALRLLGVLLVVLGIVAMHQMAGGTHTATMQPGMPARMSGPAMTVPPADASLDPMHPDLSFRATAVVGRPADSDSAHPAVQRPSERVLLSMAAAAGGAGAMPLCLAVLAGLLLIGLPLLLARRTPGTRYGGPRVAAIRSHPPGRGPPRDLLAQLCVLRT